MSTYPRLVHRSARNISLAVWNDNGVASYQFRAATSLNGVFSALFTVPRGRTFRSPSLVRRRLGMINESRRGLTTAAFDLGDYSSATVPSDVAISFIRVRELDSAGATLSNGPILIVPPPDFFSSGRRTLVLNGTAPNVAAGADNLPPLLSLVCALPKFADEVTIDNTDTNSLFISFGAGLQEYELTAGESRTFTEAGVDLLYLRSDDAAGTTFVATFAIVNGLQS